MGQGRHGRLLNLCLLLVAAAIQGITPDAQNLASPLAIRLLYPSNPGDTSTGVDDDFPDEICVVMPEKSVRTMNHQTDGPRPACLREAGTVGLACLRQDATSPLVAGPSRPAPDRIHSLCRLIC